MKLLIKNALIHDSVNREPYAGDILVEDGKISRIAPVIDYPGADIFNAQGMNAYAGFVDAHSHLGLAGYGIGYEGMDYNEMNDIVTPHLRGIDGFKPMQPSLEHASRAGVTTVCVGPGSANVLGGTFFAVKTVGRRVDDMIVKDPIAMKCAFGENPKRCYRDKCDTSRMTTAAKLREMLFKAREYERKIAAAGDDESKLPPFDMKLEALCPVIRGELPLKAHAHAAEDIFTAIRIAKEFGCKLTLEHVTEGHLIVEELVEAGYPCAVGPSLGDASKWELRNMSFTTPGILARAGVKVSIITDADVIPQEYLPLCAGLAVKSGMDPFDALQAITINPAMHAGIQDRVGSLEPGKDADIVITNGDPFEVNTRVCAVFVNGKNIL
ncbi:MAG: amidohydrolase [Clostridia bacterium]|nr:amidohydrolase [Clostridia bacterium]